MTDTSPPPGGAPRGPLAVHELRQAEAWVFDLDNTLYPASSGLFEQIDRRMRGFIAEALGLGLEEAHAVQKEYFRQYGTTLRGLMIRHGLEPAPYLEHVHDIDLDAVAPSPELDAVLGRIPGRKLIFTNATAGHARRIMERLGVGHRFDAVFDIVDADYLPKPDPGIYDRLVALHGLDPGRTVMVEDIARNLAPAAALGMTTVWVGTDSPWAGEGAGGDYVHHAIEDLVSWLEEVAGE